MDKETKKCPFCGEEILAAAKKCKYCKEFLPQETNDEKTNNENSDTNNVNTDTAINNNASAPAVKKPVNPVLYVVGAVVLFIIIACINSASNSLYAGCRPGDPQGTTLNWYCEDNPYYDKIMIISNYSNNYSNYYVYQKREEDGYKDDFLIGSMTRKEGQYVCSAYASTETIKNCNEKQLAEFMKATAKDVDIVRKLNNARADILTTHSNIYYKVGRYVSLSRRHIRGFNSQAKDIIVQKGIPNNCEEMKKALEESAVSSSSSNNCQIKFSNGTLAVFSPDFSKFTVYDNADNPEIYATYSLISQNIDSETPVTTKYSQDIVTADNIKDIKSLRQLTEKEMSSYELIMNK